MKKYTEQSIRVLLTITLRFFLFQVINVVTIEIMRIYLERYVDFCGIYTKTI